MIVGRIQCIRNHNKLITIRKFKVINNAEWRKKHSHSALDIDDPRFNLRLGARSIKGADDKL